MSIALARTILLKHWNKPNLIKFNRLLLKSLSSRVTHEIDDDDKPIVYTKTPALSWQARHTRMGSGPARLSYEPAVVLASITVFMIYFCILREENDIDLEFDKTLYERIEGLEEQQIRICLKYNRENGLPIKELEDRLATIIASKNSEEV